MPTVSYCSRPIFGKTRRLLSASSSTRWTSRWVPSHVDVERPQYVSIQRISPQAPHLLPGGLNQLRTNSARQSTWASQSGGDPSGLDALLHAFSPAKGGGALFPSNAASEDLTGPISDEAFFGGASGNHTPRAGSLMGSSQQPSAQMFDATVGSPPQSLRSSSANLCSQVSPARPAVWHFMG